MRGHHKNARGIIERIHISGRLVLETPTHFGGSRDSDLVDMALLFDEVEPGRALIPGTTIAGALRNYLRERLHGYGAEEEATPIQWLFGPFREDDSGDQSLLIVDDALTEPETQRLVLRDGVAIDSKSGTASDQAKFDVELLEAGTSFPLHFELSIIENKERTREQILSYLVAALQGLEQGEIRLGLRKRRGYGQCRVTGWQVRHYDLTDPQQLCAWLETPTAANRQIDPSQAQPIAEVLGAATGVGDRRHIFDVNARFSLEGSSLLIRSGFGESDTGPDAVHLHALNRDRKRVPVVPGTSWAGVVRHQAQRIAHTIVGETGNGQVAAFVDSLFGALTDQEGETGLASRVRFDETEVQNGRTLYQTRVRIDRFTGGSYPGGLFEEAPVYGTAETGVGFRMSLRNPEDHEKGLLLLVLKDLWTGDLPVGGEASVGRGRLRGVSATITERGVGGRTERYSLNEGSPGLGLSAEEQNTLQGYVDALWEHLQPGEEETVDG